MTVKPAGDLTIFEVGALCEIWAGKHRQSSGGAGPPKSINFHASAIQLLIAIATIRHFVLTGITGFAASPNGGLGA